MIEAIVDLWDEPSDAKCILTNCVTNKNGRLIMGAGVAKEAADRYPDLSLEWGIMNTGGKCGIGSPTLYAHKMEDEQWLVNFPTKVHWDEKSNLDLIELNSKRLMWLLGWHPEWKKVLLPRPGTGLGGLDWKDVKAAIEPILDDRVWVVHK